jgi:hypothetical protein
LHHGHPTILFDVQLCRLGHWWRWQRWDQWRHPATHLPLPDYFLKEDQGANGAKAIGGAISGVGGAIGGAGGAGKARGEFLNFLHSE